MAVEEMGVRDGGDFLAAAVVAEAIAQRRFGPDAIVMLVFARREPDGTFKYQSTSNRPDNPKELYELAQSVSDGLADFCMERQANRKPILDGLAEGGLKDPTFVMFVTRVHEKMIPVVQRYKQRVDAGQVSLREAIDLSALEAVSYAVSSIEDEATRKRYANIPPLPDTLKQHLWNLAVAALTP